MPSDLREAVPWKITSSIFWPLSILGLCSPSAQRMASATLDLPHPLGPTMQVTPGKTCTSVLSAKDLNPWTMMLSSLMIPAAHAPLAIDTTGSRQHQRKKPQGWGRGDQPGTKCWRSTGPSCGSSRALEETALLVLLTRSAGAGIVAAHLLAVGGARPDPARRAGGSSGLRAAAPLLPAGRRGHRGPLRNGLLAGRAHLEELLDEHLLQVVDHLLEHLERFLLVLHQRVALAVAAQTDALLEVIHVQEVLAPELVDPAEPAALPLEPEHDPALQPVEQLGSERGLPLAVAVLRAASDQIQQRLMRRQLVGLGVGGQPEVELAVQGLVESLEVPVLRVGVGRRIPLDGGLGQLSHPVQDRLLLALVLETLATQAVDDFPLLVHHIVVLEEVLADLEVARLHALLRRADGARDQLVLDGLALFHAQAVHDPLDALRPEDPQEVVFEREVEARGAGVALASGAPPELVVDPPRLVALGGDDVEPTQRYHPLVLRLGQLPGLAERPCAGRRGSRGGVQSPLGQDRLRQEVGVAPEQDVGAAPRHVGGDGHGGLPAGLGHDLGLPLMVLRVQHLVGDPAALEELGEPLGLLDGDGPDQHGLPLGVALGDLVGDRVELLPLGL